jgi:hypothetical protein
MENWGNRGFLELGLSFRFTNLILFQFGFPVSEFNKVKYHLQLLGKLISQILEKAYIII